MKIYTTNRTLWRSIGMYCHRGVSYSTDNSLQFFILPVWFLCSKGKAQSPINPKRELPELLFPFSNKRKWVPAKDVQDSHSANGAVKLIRRERRAVTLQHFQAIQPSAAQLCFTERESATCSRHLSPCTFQRSTLLFSCQKAAHYPAWAF